ncbi:MAG: hypothetical protein QE285_15130 [Aquabacterium sp.]|nr:hypothetical protein [Aquabacterium sp.]
MRRLLVSDLHDSLPRLDRVVLVVPPFDLAVLAGDGLTEGLTGGPLQAALVVPAMGHRCAPANR